MILNSAVSIGATKTRAGVLALSTCAGQLVWAVRICSTLRSTVRWASNHLWQTTAVTPNSSINWRITVRTARVGLARVLGYVRLNGY